ncbi:S8 family peptidase [Tautonia marina]|uniref:S8 family peptidase n=1 Tax=Tautonia marina TaxID=2653855 RepID=UPI00137584B9|nr:S8 family serine peptidase [Tautonia marina]
MTGNRSRRNLRPGVEAVEARCLLSVANPINGLEPIPAKTNAAPDTSSAKLTSNDVLIGASATRALYGVTGAGLTAAVIDTGVNYDHSAFGGGFGSGKVVVAGHDFGAGDTDPRETNGSHGTAVAGIIASRDPSAPGVAPEADIAALRVFGDDGRGSFDGIADSLQWVIDHHKEHNITVVNLSISDGKNYLSAPTLFASPVVRRIMNLIDQLEELRIPVVTAAGNSFSGQQGMGFTAIVENTISVTGSDGANGLASDAQRLGREAGGKFATDLAAPGRDVMGPWNSGFAPLDGTSFAAPLVTGSVLLLQELHLKRFGTLPTVDQIEGWLRDSAKTMRDPATGFTIGRLDITAAAAMVPSPNVSKPGQGGTARPPVQNDPPPAPKPATPGGSTNRPSTPVAEPPAQSGGSDTPSNEAPSAKPPTQSPSNNGSPSNGSESPSGNEGSPKPRPVTPVPPSQVPVDSTPAPAPTPTPAPLTPPPSSPVTPPASSPSLPVAPNAPADRPETPTPAPAVPSVVTDEAIEDLLGSGSDADDDNPFSGGIEPNRPVVDRGVTSEAAQRFAALFASGSATLGVRAWNVTRPEVPPVWSRAQILRSQRASTRASVRANRMEALRPVTLPEARSRPLTIRSASV